MPTDPPLAGHEVEMLLKLGGEQYATLEQTFSLIDNQLPNWDG